MNELKTQIPVFRAKKMNNDEYASGFLHYTTIGYCIQQVNSITETTISLNPIKNSLIDPSTLSIHFQDMLASDSDRLLQSGEKDLRIFASLSEDGKGGDKVTYKDGFTEYTMIHNANFGVRAINLINENDTGYILNPRLNIIGIQQ